MKKRYSVAALIFLCVLAAVLASGLTMFYVIGEFGGGGAYDDALKYADVCNAIQEFYIGEYDMDEVNTEAFRTMIESLGDRWSYYMTAEELKAYRDYSENQYTGIGVTIETHGETGGLLIKTVTAGAPASNAGIQAGEIMTAIDSESIIGKTVAEVKAIIQEKFEQELTITLIDESGRERNVVVTSEVIYQDPISYEMLESNIGYIKIKNFESGCADGFIQAVNELIEAGAEGFVFDVRNNPGGKVSELLDMLDHLLPEGDIFISVDKDGAESVNTSDAGCIDLPMTVLINADSYSAAEFFAAALSEYGWAQTVGAGTTGKGRSQVTLELDGGGAVHISSKVYLTPNRVDLSEAGGLTPDVQAALSDDDSALLASGALDVQDDGQIQAAVEALNGRRDR